MLGGLQEKAREVIDDVVSENSSTGSETNRIRGSVITVSQKN